jgi:hypothetical protein
MSQLPVHAQAFLPSCSARRTASEALTALLDIARLPPAIHAHINLNGRYHIHPDRPPRRLVAGRDGLATYK